MIQRIARVEAEGESYQFECPCGHIHHVWVRRPDQNKNFEWGFNGSLEKPTFTPSLKVSHPGDQSRGGNIPPYCCHSFITDGNIQFLSDCTHPLAGKTVELPEIPDEWKD